MNYYTLLKKIDSLENEIAKLPQGSISAKTIDNKKYYYHRTNINNKRVEKYINFNDVENLRIQIIKRKQLEEELKSLKKQLPKTNNKTNHQFHTYVQTNNQLLDLINTVKSYNYRECYATLSKYIFDMQTEKVLILYGLRRTGKTTLMRQILLNMTHDQLSKTAFIQINPNNTLFELNNDLQYLQKNNYRYIFIDEVTLLEDFIEGAAVFSDIFASSQMKIVLSGTDSLSFAITKQEQLYDRCIMIHTTFIPYREFESVLQIKGIDEYIKYGGTMSISSISYNENSQFANDVNTSEYIDSTIARNIQHSLKYYQNEGHFRHLYNLYEKNELTSTINRVIEDLNHRFTIDVLTKAFKSNDLSISARNLLHDKNNPFDIKNSIDINAVTQTIKNILEILNKDEQTVEINEDITYQIKEYLTLLDLIMEVDLLHFPSLKTDDKITIITQPGMRYAQANALVNSLLLDNKFNNLSALQRKNIIERILSKIKGRMMEDIVLLETKLANPKKHVFQLQFAIGEYDMVIYDKDNLTCDIFEIKYSDKIVADQYKHLIDEQKSKETTFRLGTINNRYVIYRGASTTINNIQYLNVEEYLKSLGTSINTCP